MKKITFTLLMLVLLLTLVGCGHKHEYTDEVVAPTCTEKGYTKHTCECGDTYNDSEVDALGHKFGEWEVVEEATEEETGLKERVCSVCLYKETEEIAKLDHTHSYEDKVVEPTCTEGGYTEHKCECGHSYKDNETQPSHKEQVLEAKEATCTEDGLTEGKKCSVCNEVLVEQEIVEATGHEYGDWVIDLQPTSSTIGIMSKHCKICGARGEVTEIPKLDVDYKRVTFITNTDVKIKDVFVKKGEKVMEPSELLIKEGYIFDGWYYNNEKWSFVGYIVTENMILEARWKPISLTIKWLNNDNNVIKLNESLKLEMVIYPQGISQNFIFETSNSTVATVDNYGNVNALSSGKVVIRAFSKVNTKYYLDIELIIVDSDIESFEIIGSSIMKTNSENNLKVIIEPSSLDTDNIKWSVNDSSMASVSKNGVVRSNSSYGVFVVTAQLECGIYDTFEITVTSTGYPDLNGYTIKIAQSDENSTKINPFLSDYTLNDKKAKMIAWREVETLFNCK